MKEFVLTQPYCTVQEMLNSGEVAVYKEELEQGDIEKYAIVSRIGNRYDLHGNKIEDFVCNPYVKKNEKDVVRNAKTKNAIEELNKEKTNMKYCEIEMFIDKEIEKAVDEANVKHEQELALLKDEHAKELASVKQQVKNELLEKLNA